MGRADDIFRVAGTPDPFLDENPYLAALLQLPPRERKVIVRQVTLLIAAVPGLDPEGGLEVLAKLGMWLNERPQTAEYHTLRLAGLQLFLKLQK